MASSDHITVAVADGVSYGLPIRSGRTIAALRAAPEKQAGLVSALWLPVVRHVIRTRLGRAESGEADSIPRLLAEVYPLLEDEAPPRRYYPVAQDHVLNALSNPPHGPGVRNEMVIGEDYARLSQTHNPLVVDVHASPLDVSQEARRKVLVDARGNPSDRALVYGYNTLARRALAGDAAARPGPFVGAALDSRSSPWMGHTAAAHPVVGELSSWMATQASPTGPQRLFQWIETHAIDAADRGAREVLTTLAEDVLNVDGVKARWYPNEPDVSTANLLVRWGKEAPPVRAGEGEAPPVLAPASITVDAFRAAVYTKALQRQLDPAKYPDELQTLARRVAETTRPPDNVLDGVVIPRDDVPLVTYNKQLVVNIVRGLREAKQQNARKKTAVAYKDIMKRELNALRAAAPAEAALPEADPALSEAAADAYAERFAADALVRPATLLRHHLVAAPCRASLGYSPEAAEHTRRLLARHSTLYHTAVRH